MGKYGVSELTQRVDNRELPLIHFMDMRREAEKKKISSYSVPTLVEALRERVQNREQSILFLGPASTPPCFAQTVDMLKLVRIAVSQ